MVTRDLWPGADVRWIGPETERHGVRLRAGDHGIVVDAGQHQVTSFSTMYNSEAARAPRPGRGVTVRLAGGAEVSVARKHVELVPPDHPLGPEPDGTLADWWLQQLLPWGREGIPVGALVPSSFPAVCQVLHPWWGQGPRPIRWRQLAAQHGFATVRALDHTRDGFSIPAARDAGLSTSPGEMDQTTAATLVEVLTGETTTPDDVFVAVWEGWGDVPPQRFPGAARLDTQARGHFLLRGPLRGVLTSVAASNRDQPAAGFWWPADRAWFVSTEIDLEWTFVAGSGELVDRLVNDDRVEVARTAFDAAANQAADPS